MNTPTLIKGPYLADILAQPEAVRETLQALAGQQPAVPPGFQDRLMVLTGMGSSLHVLRTLNLRLNLAGYRSMVIETSELLEYKTNWKNGKALIVVSQSGRSAEVVRLLRNRRTDCPVISVTNDPDSPMARRSDWVVATRAGSEYSVTTKTYVATLAALAWLGDVLCGQSGRPTLTSLRIAPVEIGGYLKSWRKHVNALVKLLDGVQHLFYVGRGDSLASALTAGLITKEATHFHAEGMSAAAFRHGPIEMVDSKTLAIVFEGIMPGRGLNLRLVEDIRQAGGRAQVIGPAAGRSVFRLAQVKRGLRPMMEILPVQIVTLALAAMAGREAGRFEHASKITSTL